MTQLDCANQLLGQAVISLIKIAQSKDMDADSLRKMALQAVTDLLPGRLPDDSDGDSV